MPLGAALTFAYNAGVDTLDYLVLGSCSFTAEGWEKSFYPPGLKSSGYLGFYAQQFRSVEIDATFYGIPREKTVRGWFATTPDEFTFACKIPQVVTHQKCLIDCEGDLREFLNVMSCLEHKLGPMLLQFPYFGRKNSLKPQEFLHRLRAFLPTLPEGFQFALEIRNKAWVGAELLDLLRKHKVAFTLIDHPWMTRPTALLQQDDIVTSDFAYVRMLGDRSAIEGMTKSWHETVIDRSREVEEWAAVVDALLSREQSFRGAFAGDYASVFGDAERETKETAADGKLASYFAFHWNAPACGNPMCASTRLTYSRAMSSVEVGW